MTSKLFSLTLIAALSWVFIGGSASALSGKDWQVGRIIDDAVFFHKDQMTVQDIQAWLNSRVPVCDTWGTKTHSSGVARADYGRSVGAPPPYICLKDYAENPSNHQTNFNPTATVPAGAMSAAQIIYAAAQDYGINPRALLATLQKEAADNLIGDDWPWPTQYRSAMGYGCPDTAPCDAEYYGFYNQMYNAARQFRLYANNPGSYRYKSGQVNFIQFNPNSDCSGTHVTIHNQATAGLYNYTPYQPNQPALDNLYGTGDACSAYGNRNFWRIYNDWFGSSYAYIHNGLSYTDVFDADYYLNTYPDLRAAMGDNKIYAFDHFIKHGMNEGRQAKADFSAMTYRNRYQDLRVAFGTNLPAYYTHYLTNGKAEGRSGSGTATIQYITSYNGMDYSSVYNFTAYTSTYTDMQQKFGNDDVAAIRHFVTQGMSEGRQASSEFSLNSYRSLYYDLRRVFGDNFKSYYLHYITNGKAEGRTGTGSHLGGTSTLNNFDYSSVYSFNAYETNYSDIKNAFGLDDIKALQHFVHYGMSEGRQASQEFNVTNYKTRYPDLQRAFGNNLKSYYLHYITNGKAEGRIGT